MLLLNYDFYDIHSVLTILRAKPEKGCNVEIIKAVLEILSAEQIGNTIESNIVRNKLKSIETVDKEDFQWVYVNNIYTYGIRVVKDENAYSFLAKGFQLLLEYAKAEEPRHLADLADAFHNIPIFCADGCENFKKAVKVEFLYYNKKYQADLLKELSK